MQITHPFIRVGNKYEPMTFHLESMTPEQRAKIEEIAKLDNFDFSCSDFPDKRRRGSFAWLYYTKDGKLNFNRITPTGRVSKVYIT